MPSVSPGVTMPGIPSAGAYGYVPTVDSLIYNQSTHTGSVGGGAVDFGGGIYTVTAPSAVGVLMIPHNLGQEPRGYAVSAANLNAERGPTWAVSADATTIQLTFLIELIAGNTYVYAWTASA